MGWKMANMWTIMRWIEGCIADTYSVKVYYRATYEQQIPKTTSIETTNAPSHKIIHEKKAQ